MLAADDLNVGDWITVHSWIAAVGRDWLGHIIEIKAINLPFLVVLNWTKRKTFIMDIRTCRLMRISEEYINAALHREQVYA